ncbi:hypothetical protein IM538_03230 [Cytobacillus suaedae]|nr:hypothetical protein IM538_03230 [Cytobacillus suaedae]
MNFAIGIIYILVVSFGLYRIITFVKKYKALPSDMKVDDRLREAVHQQFKNKVIATILTREILVIYYLFTKEDKQSKNENAEEFTIYKNSGYTGLVIAIVSALVLEGVGISFLLHNWNEIVAWIHIILSVYGIAFLLGDLKAIQRNPFLLNESQLMMKYGLRYNMTINLDNIDLIQQGNINYEKDKNSKGSVSFNLNEFEEPSYEIQLKNPVAYRDFIGRTVMIKKIFIFIDDKDLFLRKLNEYRVAV